MYLYKNAEGEVIYVGKAKNLRSRVAPISTKAAGKTPRPAPWCAKRWMLTTSSSPTTKRRWRSKITSSSRSKPRFNILLRDDKTYPYVKLTLGERFPRVYVTRRLKKDGSAYYGPYFPANLAYRIVDLIHRNFLIPSCKVDLDPLSLAAVPAVLHQALPGALRAGAHHAGDLSGSGARREAVPRRPAQRSIAFFA